MENDMREQINKVKNFKEFNKKNQKLNEDDIYGVINIHIDGNFKYKHQVVNGIQKVLSQYIGERHLFVDDKEVNPNPENFLRGM